MSFRMGDKFPNLTGPTQSQGDFDLYKYLGDSWGLLLFYPHDGHGVGTTDLGVAASRMRQFDERGVRVVGITAGSSVEAHKSYAQELHDWTLQQHQQQIQHASAEAVSAGLLDVMAPQQPPSQPPYQFPLLLLSHLQARELGVSNESAAPLVRRGSIADPATKNSQDAEHAATAAALHSVTVVLAPDRTVASALWFPSSTGRMFDEVVRLLDSLQLFLNMSVATPADWTSGQPVLVDAGISDDQAKDLFGDDGVWRTSNLRGDDAAATAPGTSQPPQRLELPYMRWTKDPTWFAPEG